MTPRWTASSAKHGVARSDAAFAISRATYTVDLADNGDGTVDRLFIGPEHEHTTRELEVIAQVAVDGSGQDAVIFHAMQLGPKFRRMREEHPDGF